MDDQVARDVSARESLGKRVGTPRST